ncbi:MAG: DUF6801 domain-containing protein [Acidimicrobiales bacterium]
MRRVVRAFRAAGIAAGIATGGLIGTLAGGVFGAATASGAPSATMPVVSSSTLNADYDCRFPVIGRQTLAVAITGRLPMALTKGESFSVRDVQVSVNLPASVVGAFLRLGGSLRGRITELVFLTHHASPSSLNVARGPINFGPVPLASGQAAVIAGPVPPLVIGPFSASRSGPVRLIPERLSILTDLGTISCIAPRPSNAISHAAWTIALATKTASVPLGGIGGAVLAVLTGLGLLVHQRRRGRARVPTTAGAET